MREHSKIRGDPVSPSLWDPGLAASGSNRKSPEQPAVFPAVSRSLRPFGVLYDK